MFFDQSKMKATLKENSLNKYMYLETTMELHVNQEIEIWVCTSNGTDQLSLVRPEYTGPLWAVWSFQSVEPLDKIVVPNIALLYPAYKNNEQRHDGLGRVCATRTGL